MKKLVFNFLIPLLIAVFFFSFKISFPVFADVCNHVPAGSQCNPNATTPDCCLQPDNLSCQLTGGGGHNFFVCEPVKTGIGSCINTPHSACDIKNDNCCHPTLSCQNSSFTGQQQTTTCEPAAGVGINPPPPNPPCADKTIGANGCQKFSTALGVIDTSPSGIVTSIFKILLGISGGIAILLIIFSGYQLITSSGNPDTVQAARDRMTAAIVGLLFMIFSVIILEIIGVDILQIPGFKH